MKKIKFISPLYDDCFKHIFVVNKDFCSYLISSILNMDEKEVFDGIFENIELLKDKNTEKKKVVDLILRTKSSLINLEANFKDDPGIMKKNMAYLRKICYEKYKVGQGYDNTKFIQINFNNYSFGNSKINKYEYYDYVNNDTLNDTSLVVHINLAKVRQINYNNDNKKDFLINALKFLAATSEEEMQETMNNNEIIKKVGEEYMDYLIEEGIGVYDKEEQQRMLLNTAKREYFDRGINEGISKGISKGIIEANEKTAKEMLRENLDISLIEKITKLSKNEILKLKETL